MSIKADLDRTTKEQQRKKELEQKQLAEKIKKAKNISNEKNKGKFKQAVIDSFITEFANNYGDALDYNTLIHALTFNFSIDKNGELKADFQFNEKSLVFKTNMEINTKRFNENSYDEFVTNEDTIKGKAISQKYNSSIEEKEGMEQQAFYKANQNENESMNGIFIPSTDNSDRYGNFNKINKLVGYQPVNVSCNIASNNAKKEWQKINK